jgi:antibiotic biosynthesis monooxygenase (ABM) superfamily enzyme
VSSRRAARLVVALRLRAGTIRAYEATPSLRERLVRALPPYRGSTIVVPVSPALRSWPPSWREGHDRVDDDRDLAA